VQKNIAYLEGLATAMVQVGLSNKLHQSLWNGWANM